MIVFLILMAVAILCFVIAGVLALRLEWDAPLPDYTDEELDEQVRRRNEETAVMAGLAAVVASL